MAMLVCDAQLSDDVVYKFTKALWTTSPTCTRSAKAKLITLETALDGVSVPYIRARRSSTPGRA